MNHLIGTPPPPQGRLLGDAEDAFASGPPPKRLKGGLPTSLSVKIMPPAVEKNLLLAVKIGQNFASSGNKRSYYFGKCCRRGSPRKNTSGPPPPPPPPSC